MTIVIPGWLEWMCTKPWIVGVTIHDSYFENAHLQKLESENRALVAHYKHHDDPYWLKVESLIEVFPTQKNKRECQLSDDEHSDAQKIGLTLIFYVCGYLVVRRSVHTKHHSKIELRKSRRENRESKIEYRKIEVLRSYDTCAQGQNLPRGALFCSFLKPPRSLTSPISSQNDH